MSEFNNVNFEALKKKAYNYRWAEVEDGIIPLTAADPDYPCAPVIKKAMMDYIEDGYFSYTPKLGLEEFKASFVNYVKRRKGEIIDAKNVLPVDSAARGMFIIAKAFLKEGDEMIVFDPCDFLFREACLASKANVVCCPVDIDVTKRKMDLSKLESCITSKTKMIGLCNPHNPYGMVYSKEDLEYIMSLCEKYDLYIMNDEIWSDIIYPDASFNSIYCLGNDRCHRVLSVYGYSKTFGLAGLRIGTIYTTDDNNFNKLVEASEVLSTAGGATSISQVAAVAAMDSTEDWYHDLIKHLEHNRDYAVDFINKLPYLKAYKPQATYLLYVDIRDTKMNSEEFTNFIKENEKLALIPGGHKFFGDRSEGYIRICIATGFDVLKEGLDRLKAGVEKIKEQSL